MLARRDVHVQVTHFCQWGTPWRKATTFMFYNMDPSSTIAISRRCAPRGNICSRTQEPHKVLRGCNEQNVLWTHIAQPYPCSLARCLARILYTQSKYQRLHRARAAATAAAQLGMGKQQQSDRHDQRQHSKAQDRANAGLAARKPSVRRSPCPSKSKPHVSACT